MPSSGVVPAEVITLSLPATSGFRPLVRSGLGALGSRLGWSGGQIGTLHTTADIALAALTEPEAPNGRIEVRLSLDDEDVSLQVHRLDAGAASVDSAALTAELSAYPGVASADVSNNTVALQFVPHT